MECEALYLNEAVDEYTIFALTDFERKKFQNVANMGISAFDLVRATSFFLRMVGRGTLCLKNSEIDGSDLQRIISGRMTAAKAIAQVTANEAAAAWMSATKATAQVDTVKSSNVRAVDETIARVAAANKSADVRVTTEAAAERTVDKTISSGS